MWCCELDRLHVSDKITTSHSSAAITTYTLSIKGSHCHPINLTGKKLCWSIKRKLAPFIESTDSSCSRAIWTHLQAQGVDILEFAKTEARTQQVLGYIHRERDKLTPKVECSAFGDASQFCKAHVLSNEALATCTDPHKVIVLKGHIVDAEQGQIVMVFTRKYFLGG